MPVKMGNILEALVIKEANVSPGEEVAGLAYHTDEVRPGCLFFALPGTRYHGFEFVSRAAEKGASAVVVERDAPDTGVPSIRVPDVRLALAVASDIFYNSPSLKLRVFGVTGTNGKTTTTHLIKRIIEQAGHPAGLLGTVDYQVGEESIPVRATTPEASDLQYILSCMREKELMHAVVEVSSHALEWKRVAGINFDVAVLTNITGDHLDFHGDFNSYLGAKTSLFARMGGSFLGQGRPRVAVLNSDDPHSGHISRMTPCQVITYGINDFSDVAVAGMEVGRDRTRFTAETFAGKVEISLQLRGRFNLYNAAAAIAAGLAEGVDLRVIKEALEKVEGIPGRFEKVDAGQVFTVIVDYAHTVDGLENVLLTARELLSGGRLITVFGCGGDRDSEKRPLMGKKAAGYSDICIITSDNPRSEAPASIIEAVTPGVEEHMTSRQYRAIEDREEAIKEAVGMARENDIVVIAGKGHEEYQVFKERVIPFSDRETARRAIKELL